MRICDVRPSGGEAADVAAEQAATNDPKIASVRTSWLLYGSDPTEAS
jgi:hypothetical protein